MTPDQDERLLAQQFETIFTKYYSVVKYFALMLRVFKIGVFSETKKCLF